MGFARRGRPAQAWSLTGSPTRTPPTTSCRPRSASLLSLDQERSSTLRRPSPTTACRSLAVRDPSGPDSSGRSMTRIRPARTTEGRRSPAGAPVLDEDVTEVAALDGGGDRTAQPVGVPGGDGPLATLPRARESVAAGPAVPAPRAVGDELVVRLGEPAGLAAEVAGLVGRDGGDHGALDQVVVDLRVASPVPAERSGFARRGAGATSPCSVVAQPAELGHLHRRDHLPVGMDRPADIHGDGCRRRARRRPGRREVAFSSPLARLVSRFGIELESLDSREITVSSIDTDQGPGLLLVVTRDAETGGAGEAGGPVPMWQGPGSTRQRVLRPRWQEEPVAFRGLSPRPPV